MEHFGFVLATKMLVDGGRRVRFMYREKPDNLQDSGWRFFCGDEDDAYVSDPDNIAVYDINTILALDSSVTPYLGCPEGTALEREFDDEPFTVAEGFPPDEGGD